MKSRVGRIIVYVLLFAAVAFYMMPVYVMIINGPKDKSYLTLSDMWHFPRYLNGGRFPVAWETLSPNLWASLRMVLRATIFLCFLGAINGYSLSKWKFRGSDLVFTLILFGMFISYQAILIPLIRMLDQVGLYGKWQGLVLVHVIYGIPIACLIFRNYFANVASELVEAARIDGAGLIQTFLRIILPLSLPAFVVVGIFQFTNIWNDFFFGVTVVVNPKDQPVTVALNSLNGNNSVDWTVVIAAAVLSGLPTALVYIFLGRFFIRGLLAGPMEG